MKTKFVTLACVLTLGLLSAAPCRAAEQVGPAAVAMDTVLGRPACLAATVVGSAFFVVSLPFAAISKSVKPSYNALVVRPAKATFTRPLGDFSDLSD